MQHDEVLIKELLHKHFDHPHYRKMVCQEYQEQTGNRLPMATLRDMLSRWGLTRADFKSTETKTFNQRTDEIIDEPRKLYTSEELLEAMGIDPDGDLEFDRATVNRWWLDSGDILERIRNGQLKIHIKKKTFELTESKLDILLSKKARPLYCETKVSNPHGLLEIPLFDKHYGINTYEDYKETQAEIYRYISSQEWELNLYTIGQDLFHNDDFRGRTTSGTPIEQVDIEQAWQDALNFYCPLIERSIEKSIQVKVIFSRGNHDETLGWAFVKLLKAMYPQVEFDDTQDEFKCHIYKGNFLGYTHGDKVNDNKLAQIFNSLYRLEMAQCSTRIIKRGHVHTNKMIDEFGTLIIGLGTKAKTDAWHRENGYVGNRKKFEIFIYDDYELKAHIYI